MQHTSKVKKITVDCHGPIAVSKKYQSPWEDVWLSWTGKPGRKKYYLAPCLISKPYAESEHEWNLKYSKEHPDPFWEEELKQYVIILKTLESNEIYIEDINDDISSIYTQKDFIDRNEAEKMIAFFMKLHGFNAIRCKWNRPKFIAIPT